MMKNKQKYRNFLQDIIFFLILSLFLFPGCGDREDSSQEQDDILSISVGSENNSIQVGTKSIIEFTGSGGTGNYEWDYTLGSGMNEQAFSFVSTENSAILTYNGSIISSGTIIVNLRDSSENKAGKAVIVHDSEAQINIDSKSDSFIIGTPHSISFTAQGGIGGYKWDISFSNTGDINSFIFSSFGDQGSLSYNGDIVSPGSIIILAEDQAGNFANVIVSINNNPEDNLVLEFKSDSDSESDSESGSFSIGMSKTIILTASGGTGNYFWGISYSSELSEAPFNFSSTGDSGTLAYTGAVTLPGTITVIVKDELGASANKIIEVNSPGSAIKINSDSDINSIDIGTQVSIILEAEGGVGEYTWDIDYSSEISSDKFSFSGSGNQAVLSYDGGITSPGTITIILKDELGGSAHEIITINSDESPVSLVASTESFSGGTSGSILISASGGIGKYTWETIFSSGLNQGAYNFSSSDKTASLFYNGSATSAGNIIVIAEDETGKSGQTVITIDAQESDIVINIESGSESEPESDSESDSDSKSNTFVVGDSGAISFKVSGGNGGYQWSVEYSDALSSDAFKFSSSGNSANVTYEGRYSLPGAITVNVKDNLGASAQKIVVVNPSQSGIQLFADGEIFRVGIPKIISFTASGGAGDYEWKAIISSKFEGNSFTFSPSGSSATLTYDGGNTGTGEIAVSVKDEDDNKSEKTIIVSGGEINGVLEIQPETVGIGGETLCIFNLNYPDSSLPISESNIVFKIEQGPAEFINSSGETIGTFLEAKTDLDGRAYIKIKVGSIEDVKEDSNVVVSVFSDTGVSSNKTFSIDRNYGIIQFTGKNNVILNNDFILDGKPCLLDFQLKYTDKDGKPLKQEEIDLDKYLETIAIQEVSLASDPLDSPIITDDNGAADFVLKVKLSYDRVEEYETARIGSLVFTGIGKNGETGSFVIIFDKDNTIEETEQNMFEPVI